MLPIVVSSRTVFPESAGTSGDAVAAGGRVTVVVTAGAGVATPAGVSVFTDEDGWVHPAQSTSAAIRSPAMKNDLTGDIPITMGST
jgi:accessory colonization factor AcfC